MLETDGEFLPESDAILFYLAEGTPFLPEEWFGRTRVLQWMFFEQYSHEPNIATSRFWIRITHGVEMTEEHALAAVARKSQPDGEAEEEARYDLDHPALPSEVEPVR